MSKNSYAKTLMAQRSVLKEAERKELISRTFETTYKLSVIANNIAFGKGSNQAKLFRSTLNELFTEYGKMLDEVDADYADGKVDERYRAIIGE